jgi:hypothetical protein
MRKIGKKLFTFQKLMKMWLWGNSITNFTTVLLLFLTKKKQLVESRRWKKFCLTKHFSGRVYLHNGKTSFSVTRFPIFDPGEHTQTCDQYRNWIWDIKSILYLTIYITIFVTRGRHFGAESQFDHIFSRQSRKKILVKLTQGPQNDSRGHKNSVE